MTFSTEASNIENLLRDLLCGGITTTLPSHSGLARRTGKISGLSWHFLAVSNASRLSHEVFAKP